MFDILGFVASLALAILCYLIGSIPFGYIIVKIIKGIDIRTMGSGNIGATNVARIIGWPFGIVVFLLDALKGAVAVYLSLFAFVSYKGRPPEYFYLEKQFGDGLIIAMVCILLAIVGHLFPIYLRFKGGKGVATAFGVLLVLMPIPTLSALVLWGFTFFVLRYVSLASIIAAISLPIIYGILGNPYWKIKSDYALEIVALTVSILVILRHIPNIKRLINGTEPKVRFGKKVNADGK